MFAEFVKHTRLEPFQWGQNDCAMWCGSAVKWATGYDPAADLRGTYSTWFECRRVLMEAGGMDGLIAPRMARFPPLDGDGVAIIKMDGRQICALMVSGRAIVRTQSGLRFVDAPDIIRGWSW